MFLTKTKLSQTTINLLNQRHKLQLDSLAKWVLRSHTYRHKGFGLAKKNKKINVAEKFMLLLVMIFAAGMTFGWPFTTHKTLYTNNGQPQTQATSTYYTTEIEFEKIPFNKKTVYSSSLPVGTSLITVKGVDGAKTVTYKVTYIDDVIQDKEAISEIITKKAVDQVTVLGTDNPKLAGNTSTSQINIPPTTQDPPSTVDPNGCGSDEIYQATYNHCAPSWATARCVDLVYVKTTNKDRACRNFIDNSGLLEWYGSQL